MPNTRKHQPLTLTQRKMLNEISEYIASISSRDKGLHDELARSLRPKIEQISLSPDYIQIETVYGFTITLSYDVHPTP